jgi:hypothetical protein
VTDRLDAASRLRLVESPIRPCRAHFLSGYLPRLTLGAVRWYVSVVKRALHFTGPPELLWPSRTGCSPSMLVGRETFMERIVSWPRWRARHGW